MRIAFPLMLCRTTRIACWLIGLCLLPPVSMADASDSTPELDTSQGDALLSAYFQQQTAKVADDLFADIDSLEDWQRQREARRAELFEMLGLAPLPVKTPLQPVVTGQIEREGIRVERLHFQSLPGLYVTANLYRPSEISEPLPAVLYVCGHGRVKKDGISYGNKATYQHHGAWLAQHGYICLTIDTIQLGEIEGHHHGTHHYGWWWWNNRGYTPAGVEAWNSIRAVDYLQSRSEVDGDRLGVTGRSGGGIYSWWVAALDERIKVAVPVAGITSMKNQVVDGCVEGHCDCMFMINIYRWDFPLIAALVAPRPLLISNSDKDRIFPLDGVVDVYQKVQKIYRLYGAEDKLGLNITEGPHKDTQELRVHAFRWLNRHLKDDESLIRQPAEKLFEPEELKVFDELPADERVTTIHESFVPAAAEVIPQERQAWETARRGWMEALNDKSFRGWPEGKPLNVEKFAQTERDGIKVRVFRYDSQSPFRLPIFVLEPSDVETDASEGVEVIVLDEQGWQQIAPGLAAALPDYFSQESISRSGIEASEAEWEAIVQRIRSAPNQAVAYVVPRGIGPTEWTRDPKERTHIRRRFMLLGQTLDSMRVWDVRQALQALSEVDSLGDGSRILNGRGAAASWAMLASLYADQLTELQLEHLPPRNREAFSILSASRFVQMPQLLTMAADRVEHVTMTVDAESQGPWAQVVSQSESLWPGESRVQMQVAEQTGRQASD